MKHSCLLCGPGGGGKLSGTVKHCPAANFVGGLLVIAKGNYLPSRRSKPKMFNRSIPTCHCHFENNAAKAGAQNVALSYTAMYRQRSAANAVCKRLKNAFATQESNIYILFVGRCWDKACRTAAVCGNHSIMKHVSGCTPTSWS